MVMSSLMENTQTYLSTDHTVDCRWKQLSVDTEDHHICHWFVALLNNNISWKCYICFWHNLFALEVSSFPLNTKGNNWRNNYCAYSFNSFWICVYIHHRNTENGKGMILTTNMTCEEPWWSKDFINIICLHFILVITASI